MPATGAPYRSEFHIIATGGKQGLSFLITFEGPDGCGKTTQTRLLAAYLAERGWDVLATREPGGTRIGDKIRTIVLDLENTEVLSTTEFLLFSAARSQHVGQIILPHLDRGGVVISDRFADSSLAYQGYGLEQDLDELRSITRFATAGLVPDLTIFLDLPVQAGLLRKEGGQGDAWNRMEQKELAYHERVRAGYLAMAAEEPSRWIVLDATHDAVELQKRIRQLVLVRLDPKIELERGGE
jgi:dTMP kinase